MKTCGRPPSLAVILVGDDPASRTYVGAKAKAARKVGIADRTVQLPGTVSEVATGCCDGVLGAVMGYWVLRWGTGCCDGVLGAAMGYWVLQWGSGCCDGVVGAAVG